LPLEDGRKHYEKFVARPRVAGGTRKSTQKRYRTVFDKFIAFATARGITVWNVVTAEVLTDYAAFLEGKGYAHKSQVNELTTLKQAFKWMTKQGHLSGLKPIDLKLRKAESEPAYCYRASEVKAMVQHCRSEKSLRWLADIIVALACTGLRIAELVELRWSDIDFETGRLRLTDESGHRTAANGKRRELKSGRSRTFPIHPDLLNVLNGLSKTGTYVFRGPRGGRLKPDTVRRIFVRQVIEPLGKTFPTPEGEKGFRGGRLHSFRHAFCSTCANNGVPERMVMNWLGHANSEMIRHYYHLHDEEARRRMNKLDFLGGAGGRSAGDEEEKPLGEDVEPPASGEKDDS
jgi:integrase